MQLPSRPKVPFPYGPIAFVLIVGGAVWIGGTIASRYEDMEYDSRQRLWGIARISIIIIGIPILIGLWRSLVRPYFATVRALRVMNSESTKTWVSPSRHAGVSWVELSPDQRVEFAETQYRAAYERYRVERDNGAQVHATEDLLIAAYGGNVDQTRARAKAIQTELELIDSD